MYENICYVCHLKLLFTSTVESYSFFFPPPLLLYTFHIARPCLSTAGFIRAVIPGTEGPPPSSTDVSLLAHPCRRQPAVEGEMQGRR